jgi:hypothetical protein
LLATRWCLGCYQNWELLAHDLAISTSTESESASPCLFFLTASHHTHHCPSPKSKAYSSPQNCFQLQSSKNTILLGKPRTPLNQSLFTMLATPTSDVPTQPSQGGLLSIFSESFMIPLSCARESEMDSSFTFDWSDIPIVGDHDSYSSPPASPQSVQHMNTYPSSAYEPSHFHAEPVKFEFSSSCQTPITIIPYPPSASSSTATESSTTKRSSPRNSNKKKVSFSGILEIRTHSLVLGDHPCCLGGLALECGWNRCEDSEIMDLETFEITSYKRRSSELRLDYSQRRDRLQEATGLTGSQLLSLEYERVFGGAVPLMLLHHTQSIQQSLVTISDVMQ